MCPVLFQKCRPCKGELGYGFKIHCSVLLKKQKHSWSKPSAVQQAFPEALREGLNPVMSQHHSL